MQKRLPLLLAVLLAAFAVPVLASDPKPSEIHAALEAGNLEQAQQMIDQVLADQPNKAQAHYVAAEVAARRGNFGQAREQLARAEQLAPGLPFVDPSSVNRLRAQLARSLPLSSPSAPRHVTSGPPVVYQPAPRSHFSFMGFLLLIGGIVLVWVIIRRAMANRAVYGPVPGPMPMGGPMGGPVMGGPVMGGPMVMGGGPVMGGGGIMSGLATGLAVGAGVAAGEELVHHMLDGNSGGGVIPSAGAAEPSYQPDYSNPNSDMGGSDFGMSSDSWGDDSGGGGGGGDWS